MSDIKTTRGDQAPDEKAELRAQRDSLMVQNEALARRAAAFESERDAARKACEILVITCEFAAGFLSALEGWAKTEAQAGCAASVRSGIEEQVIEARKILRGKR